MYYKTMWPVAQHFRPLGENHGFKKRRLNFLSNFAQSLHNNVSWKIVVLSSGVGYAAGNDARFTLANPTPRLCPDVVGSANVNGFPTRLRLPGPYRETIGRSGAERVQCNCLSEGVVINKTPSPYQPT